MPPSLGASSTARSLLAVRHASMADVPAWFGYVRLNALDYGFSRAFDK